MAVRQGEGSYIWLLGQQEGDGGWLLVGGGRRLRMAVRAWGREWWMAVRAGGRRLRMAVRTETSDRRKTLGDGC